MSQPVGPEKKDAAKNSHSFESPSSEGPENIGGSFMTPPAFSLSASPLQAKMGDGVESQTPVQKKTSSGGLPDDVRGKMEGSFGADFSDVNIHSESSDASQMGALAYTQGNDVHFAPGQFNPGSQSGQELLGHELTHVVQQRNGNVQPNKEMHGKGVNDNAGLEKEADDMGKLAASGTPTQMKVAGGNSSQNGPVQRAANDPITDPFVVEGRMIYTYQELAFWILTCKSRLESLQGEITTAGLGIPGTIPAAITTAQELFDLHVGGGEEIITEGIRDDSRSWSTQFSRAMIAGNGAIAARAARDLSDANDRFYAQQRDLRDNVMPALREKQRSAFRADDSSALAQTADTIMTAVDCGLTLESTILAIGTERAILENMRNFAAGRSGLYVEANTRLPGIMHCITKVNQAYAAFQLLRTGMQLISGSTTELGSASAGVSAMATIYSAGGTLLGASAGVTLYANLYIGPMVSACLVMIDRIADMRSKTHNRGMIALGMYDGVNWLIEPGGRAMFDYMLGVMHADAASDTPAPTGAAATYFLDHRGNFNTGVRSGAMPVDGMIWHEIRSEEFKRWVFYRRQDVWGMLYGAMEVPN